MVASTRKRGLFCAAIAVLLCIFAMLYLLLARTSHHVDQDHFRLVTRGMTEAEVEAIFGVPAGGYDGAVPDEQFAIALMIPLPDAMEGKVELDQLAFSATTMFISSRHGPDPYFKSWISQQGVFHIAFDNQGRVAATGMWGKGRVEPLWRRLWKQLGGK